MAHPNFDTLVSTTIDNYIPTLTDVVFGSRPLLWVMESEGVFGNKEGGRTCVVPLLYAESKNVGSYSGSDVFATEDDDEVTAAQYDWKQYYGLIKIDGITEAKNSGSKTAIIDILQTRLQTVEMTISTNLNAMFWSDGAGNGGKDFLGLTAIVSDSDPGIGALGGIPVSGNDYWVSPHDSTGEAFSAFGLGGMASLFNSASEGADHPTHIFTTQLGFEKFEGSLTSNARYLDPEVADAGFQNLLYKGVPITFDNEVAAGSMWFLNMKYLMFYKLANTWFKPSEFVTPANQDVRYKYLKLYGQFTTNNRKRHAYKTGGTDW
jgi:hypothetical protein